jgi:hypothetical protein
LIRPLAFAARFAVLPNGQELVAGGQISGSSITVNAELHDPAIVR